MDGTSIQAWAGHKSFVRKDGSDNDGEDGGDFKGCKRSNETHQTRTDPDARLYRKGNTASGLRYTGHTLSENRNGLIVSAMVTRADGRARRTRGSEGHAQRCPAGQPGADRQAG